MKPLEACEGAPGPRREAKEPEERERSLSLSPKKKGSCQVIDGRGESKKDLEIRGPERFSAVGTKRRC